MLILKRVLEVIILDEKLICVDLDLKQVLLDELIEVTHRPLIHHLSADPRGSSKSKTSYKYSEVKYLI